MFFLYSNCIKDCIGLGIVRSYLVVSHYVLFIELNHRFYEVYIYSYIYLCMCILIDGAVKIIVTKTEKSHKNSMAKANRTQFCCSRKHKAEHSI